MLSPLTKLLFSAVAIGSVAGGSYGVVQLVKSSKKASFQFKELTDKDTTLPTSYNLVENKENLEQPSTYQKEVIKADNDLTSSEVTNDSKEIENGVDSKDDSPQESIQKDSKESVEVKNDEYLKEQEDRQVVSLQVEKLSKEELENKEKLQQEELLRKEKENQERYRREVKDKRISLEVTWINSENGFPQKTCFLLTSEDLNTKKDIPNLIEISEEDNDCDDIIDEKLTTTWASEKLLGDDNQERLWIRGQENKVKELFKVNWSDFHGSDFIAKNKQENNLSTTLIKDLVTDICKISEKDSDDSEDWVELECVNTKERIQEKFKKQLENARSSSRSNFPRYQSKSRKRN